MEPWPSSPQHKLHFYDCFTLKMAIWPFAQQNMAIRTVESGSHLALLGSLGVPRPSWALLGCRGLFWASVGLLFSPALPWLSSGLLGSTGLSWALLGQRCKYILRPQADIDMQPRIVEPPLFKPSFLVALRKMA